MCGTLSHGHLAGQLAGRMGAHAVGHHEQVPAAKPIVLVARHGDGKRILIVARRKPTSVKADWSSAPASVFSRIRPFRSY